MADYDFDGYGGFPRYVSVAERRAKALKQARKLEKRGRTYLRSEAVVDLRIGAGQIDALVAGSSLYEVSVRIGKLAGRRWGAVIKHCAGRIDSVVGLLQGRLSEAVLEALVDRRSGLFPAPKEIDFTCSCPDSASLCKHIAAVLYAVGARLDKKPELFFTLRSVALEELVARSALRRAPRAKEALDTGSLEGIFGIELDRRPRRSGR